jgi:glycolate oxidase
MITDEAYKALEEAVGPEFVSKEPAVLDTYCWQTHISQGPEIWTTRPVAVVLPASTEEVQAVVRACIEHGLKYKPFSVGWGGFAGAGKEDVVQVDLRRMDRIVEIDEKNMYAVVEPFVVAGVLQAEAMKVGLNTHIIGAGPGHSPLASATSMMGTGWDGIYMSTSFRNLLGVEWVLPSGEVLRLGTLGSGSGWFSGDGPGPSLRGIMRGFVGASGGLGIFTKCAVKLFNYPGPPRPVTSGIVLDVKTEPLDNFGLYMCVFPDQETYAEATRKVGEAEIGYIHHKTSHPLLMAFLAPRFWRKVVGHGSLRDAILALRNQFTIILAADTQRELEYQKKALEAVASDQGGFVLDFAAFPSLQQVLWMGMVRSSVTPMVFRATGNYMVLYGADEAVDNQVQHENVGEPLVRKYTEQGTVLDELADDIWAPSYENVNRSHCEHILLFDHRDRDHGKAMVEQVAESETVAIENYLDPGFGIIAPDARKRFSPVAQNYNEYQKKILAALDERGVSDTTFYTDMPD